MTSEGQVPSGVACFLISDVIANVKIKPAKLQSVNGLPLHQRPRVSANSLTNWINAAQTGAEKRELNQELRESMLT